MDNGNFDAVCIALFALLLCIICAVIITAIVFAFYLVIGYDITNEDVPILETKTNDKIYIRIICWIAKLFIPVFVWIKKLFERRK